MLTLTCHVCKTTLDIPGTFHSRDVFLFRTWQCETCMAGQKERELLRARAKWEEMMERYRERKAEGRTIILIPGLTLPPHTTDEQANEAMWRSLCIKWERREDGSVILWGGEM